MKAILAALLLAVGLAGCATTKVEERIVYKFVQVPAEMTEPCKLTPPPEPVMYSQLSTDKQEELLTKLIQDHTESIGICNSRLKGVSVWSEEQRKVYEIKGSSP